MNPLVRTFLRKFVDGFDAELRGYTPDQRAAAVERAAEFLERELPADQRRHLAEFVAALLAELERAGK